MDRLQEICDSSEEEKIIEENEKIIIKWLQLLINLIGTNRELNDAIDCYSLFVYKGNPVLKHYRCDIYEIVSNHE